MPFERIPTFGFSCQMRLDFHVVFRIPSFDSGDSFLKLFQLKLESDVESTAYDCTKDTKKSVRPKQGITLCRHLSVISGYRMFRQKRGKLIALLTAA